MLVKKYDSYNKIVENTDMSKQARQEGLKNLEIEFIKSLSVILSPDEITINEPPIKDITIKSMIDNINANPISLFLYIN